ncbi:aldo/keto reductase [Glaciecola sp. 2405UD65-10]|uniref:aldo/keto reductase n=1 Tax=Glaciecola sp. 2405UD65-10 TaxID=3397244 RepID=UPI003B5A9B72
MTLPIHQYFPDAGQLILGTMHLGGGWNSNPVSGQDIDQAFDLVSRAIESGINVIDMADIYTFGKSEQTIGELFKRERSLRHHLILQSKVGIKLTPTFDVKQYDLSGDWISSSVNASIKRLHDNNLDILFLHRPDPLMQLDDTANALLKLHEQGKFEYLAVSNMHAGQIAWLQSALNIPIIANQLEMSLASSDFVEDGITTNMAQNAQNGFPRGTLEYCHQAGVQLQAWGAMAQGLYSSEGEHDDKNVMATRALVAKYAEEFGVDANAIVLAWLMQHPSNIQPVLGTTNPERLALATKALDVKLTREQWYLLFETRRGIEVP